MKGENPLPSSPKKIAFTKKAEKENVSCFLFSTVFQQGALAFPCMTPLGKTLRSSVFSRRY
ncbi:hypothetical protein KKHLCK_11520 [Candidatus Electrothrix laxa]